MHAELNPKIIRKSRKAIAENRKENGISVRTLRCRIKDKHANFLREIARNVNLVWNYDNDISYKILQKEHRFVSAYDLNEFTTGATKAGLNLHSQTVQAINEAFVDKRKAAKKTKLRWRVSNPKSSRYSLGWIPFKKVAIQYRNGQIHFMGKALSLWDSYGLANYDVGAGSFSEDARGRWYVNLTVKICVKKSSATGSVGIDLGLKDFATRSDGVKLEAKQFYRKAESHLAIAQRARKKSRVKSIHEKIKNKRKDFLHKSSSELVKNFIAIFVGNVSSNALAKTTLAKSVLDAGWSSFRAMLKYKCEDAGAWFEEINESYTTQTCSCCGSRQSSPRGRAGLRIREWICECGIAHDRDVNAAKNILALGHERLAVGIPVL